MAPFGRSPKSIGDDCYSEMSEIDFIAMFGTAVEHEIDQPLDELSEAELADAAEDYFDSLSEAELRSLYRDNPINIDDPIV